MCVPLADQSPPEDGADLLDRREVRYRFDYVAIVAEPRDFSLHAPNCPRPYCSCCKLARMVRLETGAHPCVDLVLARAAVLVKDTVRHLRAAIMSQRALTVGADSEEWKERKEQTVTKRAGGRVLAEQLDRCLVPEILATSLASNLTRYRTMTLDVGLPRSIVSLTCSGLAMLPPGSC